MPTHLPPPRRVEPKKRSIVGIALNAFMVVSALILAFIVVQQEERAALGWPQSQSVAASQQTEPAGRTGEARTIAFASP